MLDGGTNREDTKARARDITRTISDFMKADSFFILSKMPPRKIIVVSDI